MKACRKMCDILHALFLGVVRCNHFFCGLKTFRFDGFWGSKGRCRFIDICMYDTAYRYILFRAEEKAIPKDLLDALAVEELAQHDLLGGPSQFVCSS